ncbi:MAG: hypothetical protein AABZ61_07995, partial [Bacteroidota bacterium]
MTVRPAGPDPHFEEVYKNLLLNYEDAMKWRGAAAKGSSDGSAPDPSRDWFDPTSPYVKLLIAQDGLYKLTYNDVAAAGINVSAINPQTLKVFNLGSQVPLFVAGESDGVFNTEDYLEFYAQRNYGKGEFFEEYTDTSVYWLTYGGANGLRMVVESTDTTGTPALSFERTVHFEEDRQYYFGYNELEIIQPEKVPGEGWYWSDFFPNTTTSFDFSLQNIIAASQATATLRVRFNGMSQHSTTPDHVAEVALNGTVLGQAGFDFTADTVFTVSFPTTLLREGTNTLTIHSVPTQATVNKFYLDWFEVIYQSGFKAFSNEITFSSQSGAGISPIQYTISGFQSTAIDVYNLTDRKKLIGARIYPVPDAGIWITFHDTSSVRKRYIVVAESQKLKPVRMEKKQFKD